MVTSSLSSSDQCKQDLLIFNQLERLEAEQPEEAHEGLVTFLGRPFALPFP